jgi:hypothetical protein
MQVDKNFHHRYRRRSVKQLLLPTLILVVLIFIVFYFPPSYDILMIFFILFFLFFYSFFLFVFKSKIHCLLITAFLTVSLFFVLNSLTNPIFFIMLAALFVVVEMIVNSYRKQL